MLGSMAMAVLVLRLGGGLWLAFAVYSLGGTGLMALLAAVMVWRVAGQVDMTGADLDDWELDRVRDQQTEAKPEDKRHLG